MSFEEKLVQIIARHEDLNEKMLDAGQFSNQEFAKIAKEHSATGDVYELAKQYLKLKADVTESEDILNDANTDADFKVMIEEEQKTLKNNLENLHQELKFALLPKDEADTKNAILEIRAGTGGEEAALFAAVLFRMYQTYSQRKGWKLEILSSSATGLDGYKEISALISGKDVFAFMKFESGVHRVQRVPETESSGRIHTSAATVAVLPEAEEIDVQINENDLRIDVFRASGAGGQHVNTTDSAVRITHIPTGIVVSQQDEKSQHKNKAKALKILRSRIYEVERMERDSKLSSMRKGQVGSGDRSERIRTYNYPQSRITDHRVNFTSHQFSAMINEGKLDEIIEALILQEQTDKLAASE